MIPLSQIVVIITSALFTDRRGNRMPEIDSFRKVRLMNTIQSLTPFQFKRLVVIDATFPENFNSIELERSLDNVEILRGKIDFIPDDNEYKIYGPSRLEIKLYYSVISQLQKIIAKDDVVLKISAGYEVLNLLKILGKIREKQGVVFRFGNPFRKKVKFCLSSFFLLPGSNFLEFVEFANSAFGLVNWSYPLEALLYDYVNSIRTKSLRCPFPKIKAVFLTINASSNQRSYIMREKIYNIFSNLGIYAKMVE